MQFKRMTAVVVCIALMCTAFVYAFNDTAGHWAEQYAVYLNQKGILNGDDLGNANLANNVKRSEFTAMLVRMLYGEVSAGSSFSDVTADKWYYGAVGYAAQQGIVSGGGDGRFYPDKLVTREEIVLMLYRALGLSGGECSFTDVGSGYKYYKEIAAAVSAGIINGYSDGSFMPTAKSTRGEACAMLYRVLNKDAQPETPVTPPAAARLNLSWQQVYNKNVTTAGSYVREGLDVVSPMWFKIVSKTDDLPQSYEYPVGDNMYLQDFGNSAYMADAAAKGYKVWPMFKGDGTLNGQGKFLNNESARKTAVELLRSMAKTYGFTGINMDFENMRQTDRDAYTTLVKEVAAMCREEGLILSVDVTKYLETSPTYSLCYDRAAIAQYADYVALMAYDQNGTWSKKAGSVAGLDWVEESIKITLNEVPAEKLLLGIPFYARLWREENGTVVKTSAIGMDTAKKQVDNAGAQIVYDQKTGQNYAEWTDGNQVCKIWLEDETSVKARLDLIAKYNLAGAASWSMTFERPSIWGFIKENLR